MAAPRSIDSSGDTSSDETILSPERVTLDVQVSSKKRLLEEMASLLTKNLPDLHRETVFQILVERERLGSTGIGDGVALPHGRVSGIEGAIGAFARLREPLDFDAIDGAPVRLVFGLLVPADATQAHLKLLAHLASLFSREDVRESALTIEDPAAVHKLIDV